MTKKLLHHYDISTKTLSYHQHSDQKKVQEIYELLVSGKQVALVTDAGTPSISDPGNKLIADLHTRMQAEGEALTVVPIPGASALTAALSVAGFPTDKFVFLGFPPHKKKRKKFFEEAAAAEYTVAFYESSHRIEKAIAALQEVLGEKRQLCLCRELTKQFESVYRGTISEIASMDIPAKGEFVVIIDKK